MAYRYTVKGRPFNEFEWRELTSFFERSNGLPFPYKPKVEWLTFHEGPYLIDQGDEPTRPSPQSPPS